MANGRSNTMKWVLAGAGFVVLLGVLKRKQIMSVVHDAISEAKILKLHPVVRERARKFLADAEKAGYKLRITSSLRDFAEQQALYDQGRTKPGKIVTNAKPGQSFHNFGLAIDVVEMKDGTPLWENPNWAKIAQIGKAAGFSWGGDWKSFKDIPHFEYNGGYSLSQLMAMYNSGKRDKDGYLTNIA